MRRMIRRFASSGVAAVLVAMVALASLPGVAFADSRCGGRPGVQVWTNAYQDGDNTLFCAPSQNGFVSITPLADQHGGLLWPWDSWDNRISSFETFNMVSGSDYRSCFYTNNGFGGDVMKKGPNGLQNTLSDTFDEEISSLKINIPVGTGSCP